MTLGIQNYRCKAVLGVLPKERRRRQLLSLDIKLDYDARAAANSDNIAHALDYRQVLSTARAVLVEGRFQLLEAAVSSLGSTLLSRFPEIRKLELCLRKYRALPGLEASWASLITDHNRNN